MGLALLALLAALAAAAAPSPTAPEPLYVARHAALGSYEEGAWRVAASTDGGTLYLAGTTGTGSEWDSVMAFTVVALDAATREVQWEALHYGPGQDGRLYDVALSPDGTYLVAIGSVEHLAGRAFATVAFDSETGTMLWETALPDAAGAGTAFAVAISPDSGSVAVAGTTHGALVPDRDATTALFDARTGDLLWLARHAGLAHGRDEAWAVAFAPDGATVVSAGESQALLTGMDVFVVAYDVASGAMRWSATRDGGLLGDDVVWGLAVDALGKRAYVVADAWPALAPEGSIALTLAFDLVTGLEDWARQAPSPWSTSARDVAVSPDASAVYVVGSVATLQTGQEALAFAYDAAAGIPLWTTSHAAPGASVAGATAMLLSADGASLLIGGYARVEDWDVLTLALDSKNGSLRWMATDNGEANARDIGRSIVLVGASDDTVVVAGESLGTRHHGFDMAGFARDVVTGTHLWTARHDVLRSGVDEANAVAVSPDGSRVFMTGAAWGHGSGMDWLTLALDATTSAPLWDARHNGAGDSHDYARAAAVSADGARLFIAGQRWGGDAAREDIAAAALDTATGETLWEALYDGPEKHYDVATALAVTPDRVLVAGESSGDASTGLDAVLLALDVASGASLWTARFEGAPGAYDVGPMLAIDPTGARAFIAHTTRSSAESIDQDVVIAAVDVTTGDVIWRVRHDSGATESAAAIKGAPDGARVYVTGKRTAEQGDADYLTLALDAADGRVLWEARLDHTKDFDLATALAVAPDGARVYVAGTTREPCPLVWPALAQGARATPTFPEPMARARDAHPFASVAAAGDGDVLAQCEYAVTTVAYDAATGAEAWRAQIPGGVGDEPVRTPAIAVAPDGARIFVAAPRHHEPLRPFQPNLVDFATVALDEATGAGVWIAPYDGSRGRLDIPLGILLTPDGGRVIAVGASYGTRTMSDFVALAYDARADGSPGSGAPQP